MGMEFTDRYQALGIPYPNLETVCLGPCEGVGFFPLRSDDGPFVDLWLTEHARAHTIAQRLWFLWKGVIGFDRYWLRCVFESCDGWHFVKCPNCNGSGKRGQAAPVEH